MNSSNDPWSDHQTQDVPKALPLVEDKLTPETYRAEALGAIARLPADTRLVFTAQIGELRANSETAAMLEKLGKHPKLAAMSALVPPCVIAVASDAEWLVFGAASLNGSEHGVLVLRGRWRRSDVEKCFGETVKPDVTRDGGKLYRVGDLGWLDFIDAHTAYITIRPDLEPEAVHALVRHGAGPPQHTRDLVARLVADRSIALVLDGKANDDLSMLKLPKGSDVFSWVRVDPDGLALDLAADPHGEAAAKAAGDAIKPQVEGLYATANTEAVGKIEVTRTRTELHVKGNMTNLMLGMVSAGAGM